MDTAASNHGFDQADPVLNALCELAYGLVKTPIAIWVKDFHKKAIVPRGQAGLQPEVLTQATAEVGDDSLIAEVIVSGKEATIPDIRRDPVLGRCPSLVTEDQLGLVAFPASWRSQTLGVIGLFTEEPKGLDQSIHRHLSKVGILAGEHAGRMRQRWLLATAAQAVAESPDLDKATDTIAEVARNLTACDASVLWLRDSRTNRFKLGGHSTIGEWPTDKPPRNKGGLTRAILDQGKSVRIDDTGKDERVRKELVEKGVRSLVGVPIKRQTEIIGVLFVNSCWQAHFTPGDVSILKVIAGQVSVGLDWAHRLLTPMDEVEKAIARLFTLEDVLSDLCKRIRSKTGFDYVAVQLVRPEERTIETVFGTSDTDWIGIAKHAMDTVEKLRDIQVDVVRSHPRRIEVIHGRDPRFDAWIYEHQNHQDYVRAFVPMLWVRDGSGKLVKDWWRNAHWQDGPENQLPEGGWQYSLALKLQPNIETGKYPSVYPLNTLDAGYWVYPLGTLDAGYKDPKKRITPEQARQLAELVSEGAIKVRATQLPSVLETVADGLRRILNADAASLHLSYAPNPTRPKGFAYEVAAGDNSLRFFHKADPGHHDLGHAAIEHGQPRFMPDESRGEGNEVVKALAPNLYDQGIRAIAAFPLVVDERKSILYVYFHSKHRFTEDEIRWGETFSHKAENAIRNAIRELHVRDQARYLANMHNIARMMVTATNPDQLLNDIAGYAANILAADVVNIYEYLESKKRFSFPPAKAGKLIDSEAADGTISENAIRIIEAGEIRYEGCPEGSQRKGGFVDREKIESRILCPLKDRGETVGIMFVNYRRPRRSGRDDQELVPTLAAAAAMTISATRANEQIKQDLDRKTKERDALHRVDHAIVSGVSDDQRIMGLILEEAITITGAKAGFLYQYHRRKKWIELVAQHGLPGNTRYHGQHQDQGIVGQVARTRKPVLVENIMYPEWRDIYHQIVPETRAELAVPLQDENGLWGVLNMEHPEPGAFKQEDLDLLKTFAIQIMIVVHSVNLYKQLERQIRPLRSLSVIYSHIQPRHDIDTVLRLFLTGVTVGTGLSFSRALLFLNDEDSKGEYAVHGKMAIGPETQKEANETWESLEDSENQFRDSPDDKFLWYLERAEQFEVEIREGKTDDHPLNQAIKQQKFSAQELGGAFHQCLSERKAIIIKERKQDPFRGILRNITGNEEGLAFACVPLLGRTGPPKGVLVVDYRFLMETRAIEEEDLISLNAYAGVAAMAIENLELSNLIAQEQEDRWRAIQKLELSNRLAQERENAWKYFARQAAHSIGNRIAQAEGSVFILQSSLEDSVGKDHEDLFDRLQDAFEASKALLTRWRNLLKPAEPDLQRLDLGDLLAQVERENRDRLGAVRLAIAPPELPMMLKGDRLLLTDAFAELIKNAIESMESGQVTDPYIEIHTHKEDNGDRLRIQVVNPGHGIPKQRKQSIFEPFSSTKGGQRGLGLATIKQSIEAHKGTIEEIGTPGETACFVIRLPLLNTEFPND